VKCKTAELMGMWFYGAGLRLMECGWVRVKDIDFSTNQIVVRAGKGNKDRVTMLTATVKDPLVRHVDLLRRQHAHEISQGLVVLRFPMRSFESTHTPTENGRSSGCFLLQSTIGIGSPANGASTISTNRSYRRPSKRLPARWG
jgi:integrase